MTPDLKTRLRHRRQRFSQLSQAERNVFFSAVWRLPMVALGLRLAGFQRIERAIARSTSRPRRSDSQTPPETVARLVHAASRIGPLSATCLAQSLVLWWILRDNSQPAELRLGVRKEASRLTAHAWVELAGHPLDEAPNITTDFAILNDFETNRPEIIRRSISNTQ